MKMFLATALTLISTVAFAACPEGDVRHWPSQSPDMSSQGESGPIDVPWICHNGSYREQYPSPFNVPAPKYRACKEGSIERFPDDSGWNGNNGESGPVDVPFQCRNGRFVNMYNNSLAKPQPTPRCKEGRIETFQTPSPDETNYVTEVYVCRGGALKRVR